MFSSFSWAMTVPAFFALLAIYGIGWTLWKAARQKKNAAKTVREGSFSHVSHSLSIERPTILLGTLEERQTRLSVIHFCDGDPYLVAGQFVKNPPYKSGTPVRVVRDKNKTKILLLLPEE